MSIECCLAVFREAGVVAQHEHRLTAAELLDRNITKIERRVFFENEHTRLLLLRFFEDDVDITTCERDSGFHVDEARVVGIARENLAHEHRQCALVGSKELNGLAIDTHDAWALAKNQVHAGIGADAMR